MESFAYSIVAVVIALGVLIAFHEFGHFLLAKLCGVGVLTFSIGFGRKLWVKKRGETEYALSAFPLGGYVKMVGENPDEEVQDADIERSFAHKSLLKRTAIVVAGPGFNLLLAVFFFMLVFAFYGVPVMSTRVSDVTSGWPAEKAGILTGDQIMAIDGKPVSEWGALSETIRSSGGKPLNFEIRRGTETLSFTVRPDRKEGRNVFGEPRVDWLIGIASQVTLEKGNAGRSITQAFAKTYEISKLTLQAFYKMLVGDVSPRNIGGPIMIAQMAGQQAQEGLGTFLAFLAVLSINLGVLNLLPVPVLDGGHLLFFMVEAVIRKPVAIRYREMAQQVGLCLLALLMVYAFYNDIVRLFEKLVSG